MADAAAARREKLYHEDESIAALVFTDLQTSDTSPPKLHLTSRHSRRAILIDRRKVWAEGGAREFARYAALHYRLYIFTGGHIGDYVQIESESDEQAIEAAEGQRAGAVMELWQGGRLIKRFEPEPEA